jgi:hypothetical protein
MRQLVDIVRCISRFWALAWLLPSAYILGSALPAASGDLRVDGSPCWNRTSDAFLFPAIADDGTRQLFLAQIAAGAERQ